MLRVEGEERRCFRLECALGDHGVVGAASHDSFLAGAPQKRAVAVPVERHHACSAKEIRIEQRERI